MELKQRWQIAMFVGLIILLFGISGLGAFKMSKISGLKKRLIQNRYSNSHKNCCKMWGLFKIDKI